MANGSFDGQLKWEVPDEGLRSSPIFGTVRPVSVAEAVPYVPQIAEGAQLPKNVKVDLTTDLEGGLMGCGCVSLVLSFICLNMGVNGCSDKHGHRTMDPIPFLKYVAGVWLVMSVGSFLSRLFTNNYYIVNVEKRKIFYHYKFYWNETITEYLSPENIMAVTVRGNHQHNKSSSWWTHQIIVIDNNGVITDLSDTKQDALDDFNSRAELIAAILGCNFCKCPPESMMALYISERKIYFFKH